MTIRPRDSRYRLGFDIGGTFTDVVLWNQENGEISVNKVLTTPQNPTEAVRVGVSELIKRNGLSGSDIALAIHGTTLITNALIERKGANVALLTTSGFRDVLEMRNATRYDTYDLHMELPAPLVPRDKRFEVIERLDFSGQILIPLDESGIAAFIDEAKAKGCDAVAIVFLHSFKNPVHEHRARDLIAAAWPDVTISISSDVSPLIREYERTSTTTANAYVQPFSEKYLTRMTAELEALDFNGAFFVMLSNAGVSTIDTAIEYPLQILESGPAAGALAAAYFGNLIGEERLLSFDMGGTTAKACVIDGGKPTVAKEFEVARIKRFKPGSGIPVSVPVIEMIEVGAGGGSIARVDEMGLLKVGPDSAGASPGPAGYGFGGTKPTVTDANLLLGYLNPDHFLGGRMGLDVDAATIAVEREVAAPLGISAEEAAYGIHRVVNEHMLSSMKVHMAERGRDPRRYTMVSFGGAGPIHAHALAKALKISKVVFPISAGVLSAVGFLTAPIAFQYAHTILVPLDASSIPDMEALYLRMESRGREDLKKAGVPEEQIVITRSADMRYRGQNREIEVELPSTKLVADSVSDVKRRFLDTYHDAYQHVHENIGVQVVSCRLDVHGPIPDLLLKRYPVGDSSDSTSARKNQRKVWFQEAGGYTDAWVYDRFQLAPGMVVEGPAIIEENDSTVVVAPEMTCEVDEYLNLLLRLQ